MMNGRIESATEPGRIGEHVVCNLCGNSDYEVLFQAGEAQISQIVQCRDCKLMYANPRLQEPDITALVQGPRSSDLVDHPRTQARLAKERGQVRDYLKTHLELAAMLHVIEHLPNPKATLTELHRVIKPGGYLVLETPRYDTLAFNLLGRRERSIACNGHIYFFTSETLKGLCKSTGFELLRADYVGRTLSLERLVWNVGVISKSAAVQRGLQRVSEGLGLNRLRFHVNIRDMQRFIVRRAPDRATM